MINSLILKIAESYEGEKEIKGNQGFENKDFEEQMIAVGWEKGYAWCSLFTELVWRLAYGQLDSTIADEVEELFSASAVKTYSNFANSDWTVSKQPKRGAIAIWQTYRKGKKHWSGHAAIVQSWQDSKEGKLLWTIDGNSNSITGAREGIEVATVVRPLSFEKKNNGKVLLGFIHPKPIV